MRGRTAVVLEVSNQEDGVKFGILNDQDPKGSLLRQCYFRSLNKIGNHSSPANTGSIGRATALTRRRSGLSLFRSHDIAVAIQKCNHLSRFSAHFVGKTLTWRSKQTTIRKG